MAKQQTKRILNCLPSKDTDQDWTMGHAVAAKSISKPASLPASKDLRAAWWKIGDQASTGSCVGWACTEGLLRWHLVKSAQISDKDRLSVRFIWMAAKETDEFTQAPTTFIEPDGTSLKAALDIARKYGVVHERILPFDSGALYQDEVEVFYALAAQLKIKSYFNLGMNLAKWREWIATQGPVLVRLNVDDTWMGALATNGKLDEYHPGTADGGHAVCIVGYTPNTFIVRNSWGTTEWGDKGFAYASHAYSAAAFTEAYGITV